MTGDMVIVQLLRLFAACRRLRQRQHQVVAGVVDVAVPDEAREVVVELPLVADEWGSALMGPLQNIGTNSKQRSMQNTKATTFDRLTYASYE